MSMDAKGLKFRVFVVLGLFFALFAIIFARAFDIQVLQSGKLRKRAESQHTRAIELLPRRGGIYDRNMAELAVSMEVDSVYANPADVDGARKTAVALSPALGLEKRAIEAKLKSKSSFVWLKRQVDLSDDDRRMIKNIDGVDTVKESKRYYPNRELAANLLGFEGLDSKGLEGIERHYDGYLKGTPVKVRGERDARGRTILYEDVAKRSETQGMNVVLTIDKTLQHIAEKALDKAVKRAGAKGGMAIVMDPFSAEVLAMASNPAYDPNRFHKYGPEYWRNKAVTDSFEPGSVLKMFLLAAAIEEGVAGTNDSFYCENGSYEVYDRVFHDVGKHGWLTLSEIIKHSSNIGAAKVGEKLGKERLYRYLQRFGFGAKSGIDAPGESEGRLRSYKNWSGVTLETVSFGQGISVTATQLAAATSAIANGGFLMKPRLVKKIVDPAGRVVYEAAPTIVKRVISEENARRVARVLTTVTEPDGTGANAAMDGFTVAGKTGTAQKASARDGGYRDGAYLISFLGFVPADKPRMVIYIAIDEPVSDTASGGKFAAPAFKEIAEEGLSYLGIFSPRKSAVVTASAEGHKENLGTDAPYEVDGESAGQTTALAEAEAGGKGAMPDFTGQTMRAVLRTASSSGLDVDVTGSGRAIWQKPRPGTAFPKGRPVEVRFQ